MGKPSLKIEPGVSFSFLESVYKVNNKRKQVSN